MYFEDLSCVSHGFVSSYSSIFTGSFWLVTGYILEGFCLVFWAASLSFPFPFVFSCGRWVDYCVSRASVEGITKDLKPTTVRQLIVGRTNIPGAFAQPSLIRQALGAIAAP